MAKSITELELAITANADQFKRELAEVNTQLTALKKKADSAKDFGAGFKSALPDITKFGIGLAAAGAAATVAQTAFNGFLAKEKGLAEFSAITGVSGAKLKEFGDVATDLSNKFGGPVTAQIESFKGVLSRLGPGFASSSEAVAKMGEYVNTLALAGGIDATQAMDALTTAMLQFGVDLSDPNAAAAEAARMMNVLAAGAQLGAAEIPQVADAIKQAGVAASGVGLSFEEMNAALQVLAAGGKVGAEAGVALRNVIGLLVKQSGPGAAALERIGTSTEELGKVLTTKGMNAAMELFGDKLETVSDRGERTAVMMQVFGTENAAAAGIMINGANAAEGQLSAMAELTKGVTGTNSAFQQAAIVMDTTAARMERFQAFVDNKLIGTVESLVTGVESLLEPFNEIGKIFEGKNIFKAMDDAALSAGNSILSMADYMTFSVFSLRETAGATKEVVWHFATMEERMKAIQTDLAGLKDSTRAYVDELVYGNPALKAFADNLQSVVDIIKPEAEDPFEALMKQLKAVGNGTNFTTGELKALKKEAEDMADTYKRGTSEFRQLSAAAERIQNILSPKKGPKKKEEKDPWEEARKGIAHLHVEWEKFNTATLESEKIFAEFVPTVVMADLALNDHFTFLERLNNGYEQLGLTVGSVADLFDTAFSGDGLKGVLKEMGSLLITFIEGSILAGSAYASVSAVLSSGFSIFRDAPLIAAAVIALEGARAAMNSFAVGSWDVPYDQTANIHSGEMIISKPFAQAVRSGDAAIIGGSTGTGPSSITKRQPAQRMNVNANVGFSSFISARRQSEYYAMQGAY